MRSQEHYFLKQIYAIFIKRSKFFTKKPFAQYFCINFVSLLNNRLYATKVYC